MVTKDSEDRLRRHYGAAKRVVDMTPELEEYRDILLEYDWNNWDEHLQWIVATPKSEILDWCKTVRKGEPE